MISREIGNIADTATEGLKDDKELRLDVRQELVSHIEDTIEANLATGMSEEESISTGLKAFGPVTDIAAELVSANRSRMRLRLLARIAARALLVPAAILVSVWISMDSSTAARTARSITGIGDGYGLAPENNSYMFSKHGLSPETQFLFFGDESLESKADRQRSIWQTDPTNRAYFGNYITALVSENAWDAADMDQLRMLETEIRKGEALDPENGRYNYLLAGLMVESASDLDYTDEKRRVLKVKDRALLDSGMKEMLKASRKPVMDTYSQEMMTLRMSKLPQAESLTEVIGRIGFAASLLLPDVSKQRNLARTSPEYAKLLVAEGREEEAAECLEAWYPLAKQSFEQSFTLIETLVAFALAKASTNNVTLLRQIGENDRADTMSKRIEAITAVYDNYRARIRSNDDDMDDIVKRHGGILHAMLLPAIGEKVTQEDLEPGRQVEHTWVEKGWLSAFLSWLMLIMICFFAISAYMRFVRGGESAPLLLLPDCRQMLKVVMYSVFIPLCVFYIYTRHTDLAGRDMSLRMWPRFAAELHLLTVIMLSIAAYQVQKLVDSRCRHLGIYTPGCQKWYVIAMISIIPAGLILWLTAGRRTSAMFRGTVARSLIPILALIIIIVGCSVHPHLLARERSLIQTDTVMGLPGDGGFTQIESKVTARLNREALEALKKIE